MTKQKKRGFDGLFRGIGSFFFSIGLIGLGWIFYSRRYIDHSVKTGDLLTAERDEYSSNRAGRLSYYADRSGKGVPLLTLHSINAAAGVQEISPIFNAFRGHRPVYALELPGFGKSERGVRQYSPELYKNAIIDFIKDVIADQADVVALSLTCEFSAMAAKEHPDLIRSVVMISPTGFQLPRSTREFNKEKAGGLQNLIYAILAVPLWSRALFDLIASRPSIAYFLQKSFENAIPAGMVETAYANAHQPGAHCAPIAFISGKLFTKNIRQSVYNLLELPILVLYDRDAFVSFEMLANTANENSNWTVVRIKPTRGMPHFDKPGETFFNMDQFWNKLPKK
jgi:pimeloyl-ACP methyl ester carboxylesterase